MFFETSVKNTRGTTQIAAFTATLGIIKPLCIDAAITERLYSPKPHRLGFLPLDSGATNIKYVQWLAPPAISLKNAIFDALSVTVFKGFQFDASL